MPGLGPRIWQPQYRAGGTESSINTAPITYIVPEPDKLDQTRLPLPIIASNIACRIFGRNNTNNPVAITVKWDGKPMNQTIFYGKPLAGEPFAGIWTLFNQTVSTDARLEITCGRDRAGCAAIRAGSLGGAPVLVSTDYEDGLTMNFPAGAGNFVFAIGGCLNKSGAPITCAQLDDQWNPEIPSSSGHAPGAAAYFGFTNTPPMDGNIVLTPVAPNTGIIVASEWTGVL
jgi:hypothetical protein